jgi:hypothetical protein
MFSRTLQAAAGILFGMLVLLWPAFWNGYPIVYSDTNAFLTQGILGFFVWDKPFVYGPWMALFHLQYSLWLVVIAQAGVVSSILWLTGHFMTRHAMSRHFMSSPVRNIPDACHAQSPHPSPVNSTFFFRHLVVCLLLGGLTAAPWFTSLLMPDIYAPLTVLCLFLLACDYDMPTPVRVWVLLVGAFSIASHLSHLVIAAAVLVGMACLWLPRLLHLPHLPRLPRLKIAVLPLLPLLMALALLVGTNLYGFQKFAVSPFGSVFFLARLAADGHVKPVLLARCYAQKLHLCDWVERLPADSDDFMWNGTGPVWSHPGGPIGLAPEASELVMATVRANPLGVAGSLLNNTGKELFMIGLGDTLRDDHLDLTVRKRLESDFPPAEVERYLGSRQAANELERSASSSSMLTKLSTLAGLLGCLYLLYRAWISRDRVLATLLVAVLAGVLANAFATGALSKPHYRYQTRIAWLLVFIPLIVPVRPRQVQNGS